MTTHQGVAPRLPVRLDAGSAVVSAIALAVLASLVLRSHWGWVGEIPDDWILPLIPWLDAFARALVAFDFGPFSVRELTRGLAAVLGAFLSFTESVFEHTPWAVLVALVALLANYVSGWRLVVYVSVCSLYLLVSGQWQPAMLTLSMVIVSVAIAALLGFGIGILCARSVIAERIIRPVLDLMQSIPHFAYFVPIVFLFGMGPAPGTVAIVLFALPPMVRCTNLGLRRVPEDVLEAGVMAGCSSWQLLWRVQIPSARPTLLVGVNQVIMQSLAMVVIASLVGVRGLGYDLLFSLQNLRIGLALEQGIAIVLIAVILDRLSREYALNEPWLEGRKESMWIRKYRHLLTAVATALIGYMLSLRFPVLSSFPDQWTYSGASLWDQGIRSFIDAVHDPLRAFRNALLIHVLLPIKSFYEWVPWTTVILAMTGIAYYVGRGRLAVLTAVLLGIVAISSLWEPTMKTIYLVTVAVTICIILGIPIGILASRSERASRWITLWCDTFQTFPSFIYLIPVVMLFRAGDVAAAVAVTVWAIIPVIRYTNLGLRNVDPAVMEASVASGCTRWQTFRRVQFPLATPEILLGINQTILFALYMVIIAALIGTDDLGRQILSSLTYGDIGHGLMAGLCIAFIGLILNYIIADWSAMRRRRLGLD